jgi:hypothetical protein
MAFNLQTFLSEGEARDYGVAGEPLFFHREVPVPVTLNTESLTALHETVLKQAEDRLYHLPRVPEFPTVQELNEYVSDVFAIRVALCIEDASATIQRPRTPPRGERNHYRCLPIHVNMINSIGHFSRKSAGLLFYPNLDWVVDDRNEPIRLQTPRHWSKIREWLTFLEHHRIIMQVPAIISDYEGVEAVMLAFWQRDQLMSDHESHNSNAAYIAGFTVLDGVPEFYKPVIRYGMSRARHVELVTEISRKDANVRSSPTRNQNPQRAKPSGSGETPAPEETPSSTETPAAPAQPSSEVGTSTE